MFPIIIYVQKYYKINTLMKISENKKEYSITFLNHFENTISEKTTTTTQ